MRLRVGIAPDSWGVWFPSDPLQTPWQRYLDEVAQAGYEYTELGPYGYLPTDPATLRGELDRRGLKMLGGVQIGPLHDPRAVPALQEEALRLGTLLATLGGRFYVLIPDGYRDMQGNLTRPKELDASGWAQLVETSNLIGRLVQEQFGGQIALGFHSHGDGNVETPEQLDRFLADTDPRYVGICMDTGHYAYRYGDPIEFMRRHHARTPYLHIKTVDGPLRDKANREDLPFAQAVRLGAFVEPPGGVIDFAELARALRDIDYDGWSAVEQDLYPCPFDVPLPIATRTRKYLESVGLG